MTFNKALKPDHQPEKTKRIHTDPFHSNLCTSYPNQCELTVSDFCLKI